MGDFSRAGFLLSSLPDALSVEPQFVKAAVIATVQTKRREEDQRYRETFQPHAIIICERSIPEPIWLAAVLGVDRILRIDFAEGSAPISYVRQAVAGVEAKLREWKSSVLPAFGRPQAVAINYTSGKAVEFDLRGQPLRVFDEAVRTGVTTLGLGGRSISPNKLDLLLGGNSGANSSLF